MEWKLRSRLARKTNALLLWQCPDIWSERVLGWRSLSSSALSALPVEILIDEMLILSA